MPYPPAPVLFVLPVVALFGLTVDQSIAAAIIGAANILLLWLVFVRLDVTPIAAAGCWPRSCSGASTGGRPGRARSGCSRT